MVRVSGSHYTIYKPRLCERRLFLSMKICVIIVFVHYQLNTLDSVFSYKLLCTERNYCERRVSSLLLCVFSGSSDSLSRRTYVNSVFYLVFFFALELY